MTAWTDTVITYDCSECGAKGGADCVTVHATKGRYGAFGRHHRLGTPTLPHRARRRAALLDHFPHLAADSAKRRSA